MSVVVSNLVRFGPTVKTRHERLWRARWIFGRDGPGIARRARWTPVNVRYSPVMFGGVIQQPAMPAVSGFDGGVFPADDQAYGRPAAPKQARDLGVVPALGVQRVNLGTKRSVDGAVAAPAARSGTRAGVVKCLAQPRNFLPLRLLPLQRYPQRFLRKLSVGAHEYQLLAQVRYLPQDVHDAIVTGL